MEKSKIYKNGLKLIVKEMAGLYSVSGGIIVRAGSAYESKEENGISHYIEHMLFKGTKKRSALDISNETDMMGTQINAFTAKEITCYYVKATKEHFEKSMEILSDIFFNSVFDDEESKKEKGVIEEEINMGEDTPEDLCLDLLSESAFGKTGYGQTILGEKKNVKRFTKSDVKRYMDRFYTSSNTVITVAGNITFKEAEKIADKYFAENFERTSKPIFDVKAERIFSDLYKEKSVEQAHISLSFPCVSLSSDDINKVSVLNTILGGGMSSRLFQSIREESGLAYSVYSYPSSYKAVGVLEIYAGVNPEKRDEAFNKILSEIEKLKKEGVSEGEFLRGREQIKSAFIMSQENNTSQMMLYGKQFLLLDTEFDFEGKIKDLNSIKKTEIEDLIEKYLGSEFSTATVSKINKALR